MNHPLTDEMYLELSGFLMPESKAWEEAMRDAYDMGRDDQLDQDQKNLEDFLGEFSYRGHSAEAILELRAFVNNFKSYMRPQQPLLQKINA